MVNKIVIFGAGGRAGRRAVEEAVARGNQVTAVVRDPDRYRDLPVPVVAGDVTDPDGVAAVAAGHDAAINATARLDAPSFYADATRALLTGLPRAGVRRLVAVGVGSTLEAGPGLPVHDTPGFPEEARAFSLGHQAQIDLLTAADTELDWLVVVPPPTYLDDKASRTGRYRVGGREAPPIAGDAPLFSYADLAVALIDEIESPKHHRTLISVSNAV
jgi:uncharacterized protein